MFLDGADSDDQVLGDLAVRQPLGGELGNATLAGGERFEPSQKNATGPGTGGAQLRLGLRGERTGAGAVSRGECLTKQIASVAAAVAATQQRTEIGESAGMLEPGVGALEHLDRLAEQRLAPETTGGEPGGAQRHPKRPRSAKHARQLQLLAAQTLRPLQLPQAQAGHPGA